ncbi:MAG: Lsr2 family protein [Candidatus Nanopelagicales bacterium]
MARKVHVVLEDDIDGTAGAKTITFALEGKSYEIDLSESNAVRLRDSFAEWIGAGRKAGAVAPAEARPRQPRRTQDTADIRVWAHEQGIPVSSRGRISADLRARYEAAH